MSRHRLFVPLVGLAATLSVGPMLAGVALAADPVVVVQPGDTLTGISKRHGVGIRELVKANDLVDPNRIFAGQRLRLRQAARREARARPATPAVRTHIVRPGDNLTHIARRHGVSVAAIVGANGIANPSRIYAGQRLEIPGAAKAPRATTPPAAPSSMRALMERRESVRRVIAREARRYDVPVALALAVAWQESGWQQGVVSHAGAIGVMQVMPATGEWVGQAMLGARVDLRDTGQNVRAGVRLLAHYLERYGGSVDLVLAAYYQGQTAADRHGVYPISRPYIASIRALIRIFGG